MIQDKNTATGELSYFETTLLLYLKESHPHIARNRELVRSRADEAAGAYERAIRDRFETSPSYRTLTIELTGFIQSYIEEYGI